MSNYRFPASLKPIVSKGYSYQRGGNVYRSEVTGGLPRQGRDTYFDTVPFTVTLVTSALGNQTFQLFLNKISGGADSFVMALDSGLGVKDHQCQINSAINIDTSDGINWNIAFSLLAERTDIQEDVCLTANLPDLFGCYGDGLNKFLAAYNTYATTFPRVWEPNVIAQFDFNRQVFNGISFSRASTGTYMGNGVMKTAAVDEPRYEDTGLLLEASKVNLCRQNNYLEGSWTGLNVGAGDVLITGADLVGRASQIIGATVSRINVFPYVTITDISPNTVYTASMYVGGTTGFVITAIYNATNGAFIGSSTTPTSVPTTGLVRVSRAFTAPIGCTSVRVYPFRVTSVAHQGTYNFQGVQLEAGTVASSFVPTNGTPATRSADVLTLQVQDAKRVYREYTPFGSSTPVIETVPYTGELCPPGHVRVIKVLND